MLALAPRRSLATRAGENRADRRGPPHVSAVGGRDAVGVKGGCYRSEALTGGTHHPNPLDSRRSDCRSIRAARPLVSRRLHKNCMGALTRPRRVPSSRLRLRIRLKGALARLSGWRPLRTRSSSEAPQCCLSDEGGPTTRQLGVHGAASDPLGMPLGHADSIIDLGPAPATTAAGSPSRAHPPTSSPPRHSHRRAPGGRRRHLTEPLADTVRRLLGGPPNQKRRLAAQRNRGGKRTGSARRR
jgi:hypothetical protein